jgi:hypothetical protein
VSILFQIATLVTGSIALAQGGNPEVLETVLWLELIVQIVEVTWYSIVGAVYVIKRDEDIPVFWRYADWLVTTPVMLVSILFFSSWEGNKNCMTNSKLLDDGSRVAALVCIILADWLMLSVGWAFEASNPGGVSGTPVRTAVRLKGFYEMFTMGSFSALYIGFIPFIGAFVPLFVNLGSSYSGWGLASILITFTTWTLYGVLAILGDRGYLGHQARNAWYACSNSYQRIRTTADIRLVQLAGTTASTSSPRTPWASWSRRSR